MALANPRHIGGVVAIQRSFSGGKGGLRADQGTGDRAHRANLADNLALDDLAATAGRLERREFMLVVQPIRVVHGAGAPVNRSGDLLTAPP